MMTSPSTTRGWRPHRVHVVDEDVEYGVCSEQWGVVVERRELRQHRGTHLGLNLPRGEERSVKTWSRKKRPETHLQKILCEFVPASSSLDFPPHSTLGWPDTVKEEGKRSALEEKRFLVPYC